MTKQLTNITGKLSNIRQVDTETSVLSNVITSDQLSCGQNIRGTVRKTETDAVSRIPALCAFISLNPSIKYETRSSPVGFLYLDSSRFSYLNFVANHFKPGFHSNKLLVGRHKETSRSEI